MKVVVLGAGAVGVATAWYLRKAGHDVTVVERQEEAALETSWGNGGVIHASEVEPWSQPGMPQKILKWLGKENAPLLLRYGAIPHMWRWGIAFARNCTPERFAENSRANLELALYSLRSLQEIGAEAGNRLRPRHQGRAEDLSSEGIARRRGALLRRARRTWSPLRAHRRRALRRARAGPLGNREHPGGRALFRARRGRRLQQVHARPRCRLRGARRQASTTAPPSSASKRRKAR